MLCEYENAIDGFPCHKDGDARYLSDGMDSIVYRVGGFVVKNYSTGFRHDRTFPMDPEKLDLYRDVMNIASFLAENEKIVLRMPFSKKIFPLRVNPVLRLHNCKNCNEVEGISSYVSGIRGDRSSELVDPQELGVALTNFSFVLDKRICVRGINIIPINVKFCDDFMIVTDLCADIGELSSSPFK